MTDWIGETFASDAGWDHLETLVDIGNRMAGSGGERRAAAATRDALATVGARDARIAEFPIQGWRRGEAAIAAGETEQDCIGLPRSPAGEVTGELVDVGYGLPEDFAAEDAGTDGDVSAAPTDPALEGAVVMAATNVPDWHDRFVHRREKYYRAVEAGAAAFVFRNHVQGCLAPTGSVGTAEAPIGTVPAVGVSAEVGARLARRWAGESVTVSVDAESFDANSRNVHADLGPDTAEAVLVTSHVDAHDIAEGAGDNGAGTALLVEIARALAAREADLDTRVHLIVFGAEEVGLVGSAHDSEGRDLDTVKAVVNNDGNGRGRDLRFVTNGFDDLADAVETVGDRLDHPLDVIPKLGPHSDHWPYVEWGVPGYQVTSDTGDEGRGWGHTRADTLDKLDSRTIREQAIVLTELVVHLADDDVTIARRAPEAIAAQLEAEDLAEGMKVIGDWPY
jgi:Zn-dependent M28 family amino/carboxypeptidase